MTAVKLSWFNETRLRLATKGVVINDKKHIFSPHRKEGTKVFVPVPCPKCKKILAFVFRSHTDGNVFVAVCKGCKEETIGRNDDKTKAPVPGTTCKCGAELPAGRKKFCYKCVPTSKAPLY